MGAGTIRANDLDGFVAECDRLGGLDGLNGPRAAEFLADFEYRRTTEIDVRLDPFSVDYFNRQTELYRELAGRDVNQLDGELTPLDVAAHAAGTNPYNRRDIAFLSKHTRAVLTALDLANLPPGATILDAGCCWGLSSEAMAFCGASVTAIDINPLFVELVRTRATRLKLPIEVVHSNFDDYESDRPFDLLFFYECLHHALKPWETLARLGRFVKPDGKIVFAGEPVNTVWWKDWGLRLDAPSVYCARKFGWWESGWSMEFISRCFDRAGFALTPYDDLGLNNGPIGVAVRHGAALRANESILEPARRRAEEARQADAYYRRTIDDLLHRIAGMESSRSWRITAPLRTVTRLFSRRPFPGPTP